MKGFAEKWKDLPDYIFGITKEIWEDRGIDTLNHYYTKDIPMRFPEGISIGNQNTINGTLATLSEFPDRQLQLEQAAQAASPSAAPSTSAQATQAAQEQSQNFYYKELIFNSN